MIRNDTEDGKVALVMASGGPVRTEAAASVPGVVSRLIGGQHWTVTDRAPLSLSLSL